MSIWPECMSPDGAEPCAAFTEKLECIEKLEEENQRLKIFIGAGNMSDAVTKVATEAAQLIEALMKAERGGWFGSEPTPWAAVQKEVGDVQDVLKELNLCMQHLEEIHNEA